LMVAAGDSLRAQTGRRSEGSAAPVDLPAGTAAPAPAATAILGGPEELLQAELDRILRGSAGERATIGAEVVPLDGGEPLYSLNARKLLQPASNVKLFTVAAALHYLGPGFTFRTSVYGTAAPGPAGVLPGDLVLEGRGDPNLSGRFYGDSVPYALDRLAAALRARGVTRVMGDLVADNRYFEGPEMGEGWPWEAQQWSYAAQIDALSFNDNTITLVALPGAGVGQPAVIRTVPETRYVTVESELRTASRRTTPSVWVKRDPESNVIRVGGQVPLRGRGASIAVSVDDPARFALTVFRERLARAGITVVGDTRLLEVDAERPETGERSRWIRLASHESPPLVEAVKVINKRSQNLHAEQLLKTIGAEVRGDGSSNGGIAAIADFLQNEAGVDRGTVYLADGSGLSRLNLVTPQAITRLLAHMSRHRYAREFYQSLLVPGQDEHSWRLDEPRTRGNVHAKTGTVRYVSAYSGYVTAANGERLAFAILVNNRPEGKASSVQLENAVVRALARFTR
ncbi:MAG: D-alanyl-D-alanine carboxypeptidase/D-alanyl-D-alanine-endopeptidase, partial [Gemmatimonadetes bacterium]|nr:D-alanyl-D-alanine carboxypeptidase/D-alanyl-D-alanine-endopeptidase [Gemmatimonadota bacterium]